MGRLEDFDVLPGIEDVLRAAQASGFLLIVVTNQSGIARGYFTAEDYTALEQHMLTTFSSRGIEFAGVYHCPHHPDGTVAGISVPCDCRKPAPGLILQAARDHHIDLGASILVGDKQSDIDAATAAGVGKSFLVEDGQSLKQCEAERIIAAFG